MVIGYMGMDEYKDIACGIFFELLLSYGELEHEFPKDEENIRNRVKIVQFYRSKLLYEKVSRVNIILNKKQ